MDTETSWRELSLFESHDYVQNWYFSRHQRSLNATRTREVTSSFAQGRAYFDSARDASVTVKPLLLYYGVLALARGLIMLLDRTKQEATLRPSHGLEVVDWQNTLSGGIANVMDLGIRATNGTFSELVTATPNRQWTSWFLESGGTGQYAAEFATPTFVSSGGVLSLDDLASRDHRFLSIYDRTTGRPTKVYIAEIVAGADYIDVSVAAMEGVDQALVESRLAPPGTTVAFRVGSPRISVLPNFGYRLTSPNLNDLKPLLPSTQYIRGDMIYAMEDFPDGDRFSELLRTYLLAYILGMLVRYFPSRWIALQRNERGDAAQPLVQEIVRAIERDFPGLIVHAIS